MTADENTWVKEAIQNYVTESDGRVMNEVVTLETIAAKPLKDKCMEGEIR